MGQIWEEGGFHSQHKSQMAYKVCNDERDALKGLGSSLMPLEGVYQRREK